LAETLVAAAKEKESESRRQSQRPFFSFSTLAEAAAAAIVFLLDCCPPLSAGYSDKAKWGITVSVVSPMLKKEEGERREIREWRQRGREKI
jgi:hypothetical protein